MLKVCDSESFFAWNIQPYIGKDPIKGREENQGQRVVLDLVSDLKGRNVTADNFFTTYDLADILLKRRLTYVGTVRQNKAFLPTKSMQEIKQREVFSSKFYFSDQISLVEYTPKKNKLVTVLSSFHHDNSTNSDHKKLPEIIDYYNRTKTGVDLMDKLVGSYTVRRKSNRWPYTVFCNMIDISGINAFVLWTKCNPDWEANKKFKRRLYLIELGYSLIKNTIIGRKRIPKGQSAKKEVMKVRATQANPSVAQNPVKKIKLASEKPTSGARCKDCPSNKDRKAYAKCRMCGKNVCGEHKVTQIYCNKCINI